MLVQGDVTFGMDCERMRDQVFSRFGKLDFLICNAVPQFETNHFLAQAPAEFLANIQCSVAMCSQLLYWFLPQLITGATVVQVSTIATVEPEKQLGHYVAAKSAVEGLMRVLAREFKSIRFVIARPPRMLTDTTNLPYDLNNPVSAVEIAAKLLEALRGINPGRNLFEVNL
jgi:NAD(P)-dependent dehydrogenase (short-subunit alcohol dehydrogenase family)